MTLAYAYTQLYYLIKFIINFLIIIRKTKVMASPARPCSFLLEIKKPPKENLFDLT